MTAEATARLAELTKRSRAGEIIFPDFIQELAAIGVERYHTDYCRQENTYYFSSGESCVVAVPHPAETIGSEFSEARVEQAIRQSQRGEHTYPEFLQKTMAAGCVGYFVQITGRQALYFGRRGEVHIEPFPQPSQN